MVDFCNERIGWNFRWWFEYSGGQVTDWGVHHTDIAFWALSGEEGQAVEAVGAGEFMAVEREKVLAFLLGKIPPQEMPQAYNVAYSFDVDLTLSTGNVIKLVSGPNELLIQGERGRIRVSRERLTGKPVEEVDADPKARQEIEELMAKIYGARRRLLLAFWSGSRPPPGPRQVAAIMLVSRPRRGRRRRDTRLEGAC